jgi:hypothetical protein
VARLALDLGFNFGWCQVRRGDRWTHGSVDLRKNCASWGLRLLAKTDWLTATLGQLDKAGETLEAVYFEEINFVGNNAAAVLHAHGAQLGTVMRWCALKKLPEPIGIPWDAPKKLVTGHRSAARETVLAEIQKRFPSVKDADEASAVAVMLTAQKKYQPEAFPRAAPPQAKAANSG